MTYDQWKTTDLSQELPTWDAEEREQLEQLYVAIARLRVSRTRLRASRDQLLMAAKEAAIHPGLTRSDCLERLQAAIAEAETRKTP